MGSLTISLAVVCIVLCGALLGLAVQKLIPAHALQEDAREIVKPAMGLIATLAALVLSLVIATAKSSYDEKSNQVRQMTAKVIALDNILTQYGPEAMPLRTILRTSIAQLADRIWREDAARAGGPFRSSAEAMAFMIEVEHLAPRGDAQRILKERAVSTIDEIAKARLLLFAQAGSSIPIPFLIILVFWLFALFASFTLFSKLNPVSSAALLVSALSIGGAIFLLLELDSPFMGLMQIPSSLLLGALAPL